MILWNVKLFDRTLVTVTEKGTAEALVGLLNNGTLYGVPGDPAAYEDARGMRVPVPFVAATVVEEEPAVEPRTEREFHGPRRRTRAAPEPDDDTSAD